MIFRIAVYELVGPVGKLRTELDTITGRGVFTLLVIMTRCF